MRIPQITLDTNCFINLFDQSSQTRTSLEALTELIRLSMSGKLDVAITTRVEADLDRDSNVERRQIMRKFLSMVPVVGTVLRWDVSSWDKGDMWATDEDDAAEKEIQRLLFPGLTPDDKRFSNKINDIDHLIGHWKSKRDYFVTDDTGILSKRDALELTLGIKVARPAECLNCLSQIASPDGISNIPASVSYDWHTTLLKSERHEYVLDIIVHNSGKTVLDNYYVEFHLPRSVLLSDENVVINRSPSEIAVVRVVCDGDEEKLFPGDTRTAHSQKYYMDSRLYRDKRGTLGQMAKLVLVLKDGNSVSKEVPFEELQKF